MLGHYRDSRLFGAGYRISPQAGYIARSVFVGILLCSALCADKLLTCSLSALTADVTGFRSVGRVNQNNGNAFSFSLVFDHGAKLIESPRVMQSFLSLSQFLVCSLPDIRQVFQGNSRIAGDSLVNYLTTYPVVHAFLIPCLTSLEPCRESSTPSSGGSRPAACFHLHGASNICSMQAIGLHFVTRKSCSVREYGDICDTHINADNAGRFKVNGVVIFNHDIDKVVLSLFAERGASRGFTVQGLPLIVSYVQNKPMATINQGEAGNPVLLFQRENAGIIVYAGGSKDAVAGFNLHQSGRYSGNAANSEVGGQTKSLPYVFIAETMQFKLSPDLIFPTAVGDPVAGFGKGFQCCVNIFGRSNNQLALNSSLTHSEDYLTNDKEMQQQKKGRNSSAAVETVRFYCV